MEATTWPARCPQCGRRYRVKNPDRAHACKQCSSTLIVELPEPVRPPKLPAGADGPLARPSGLPPIEEIEEQEVERRRRDEQARELKQARLWITPMRGFLVLFAGVFAFLTAVAVRGSASAGPEFANVAWNALLATTFTVAAILLSHQPFLSMLPLAALVVLENALAWMRTGDTSRFMLGVAVAVLAATVLMWRVQKTIRANPAALGARAFTGVTSTRGRKASKEEMTELLARAQRRALRWSAAAALVLLGGATAGYFAQRKAAAEPFDTFAPRFEAAWRTPWTVDLVEFFPEDSVQARASFLAAIQLRGWETARPEIRKSDFEARGPESARHVMEIPGGAVETSWTHADGAWRLTRIEMPLPLIRPFAEDFMARWNGGRLDEIQALFEPAEAQALAAELARVVRERGWDSARPRLRDWGERAGGPNEVRLTFECDKGEITARCQLTKGGVWQIRSLGFPG